MRILASVQILLLALTHLWGLVPPVHIPFLLDRHFMLKDSKNVFFAGQMTGVEGYTESAASGIIAGINLGRLLKGEKPIELPAECMTGALPPM